MSAASEEAELCPSLSRLSPAPWRYDPDDGGIEGVLRLVPHDNVNTIAHTMLLQNDDDGWFCAMMRNAVEVMMRRGVGLERLSSGRWTVAGWCVADNPVEALAQMVRIDRNFCERTDAHTKLIAGMSQAGNAAFSRALASNFYLCPECDGSGYQVLPDNGWRAGVRCSRGCSVQCSICCNPDCDNPGGQH